jgi:drug/metabolite transporter (DMT)-like permease
LKSVIFIFIACLLWATDTLIRYPMLEGGLKASDIVLSEHIILALIFAPLIYTRRQKIWKAEVSHIAYFIIIGGLGSAMGSLSFTKAFSLLNPSIVILLQKLQPLVAISLASIVLKEKIKKEFIYWALLCLVGGLMVSYNDIFPELQNMVFSADSSDSRALTGLLLTLFAVFAWGAATPFGKKLSKEGYKSEEIMAGRFLMGMLCLLPFFNSDKIILDTDLDHWMKIIGLVLLSGVLGMYFYYKGLKNISARLCSLAEMFFPFCAVSINWLFLDATLSPVQICGGALLLIGSTVVQLKHY